MALAGRELSVTLVHFATKRCSSVKHGTTLITRAKALAESFSASPTRMNNVSLKTSPVSNPGWDTGTNPETGRGLGVIRASLCSRTGTAVLKMITVKAETAFC